MSEPINKSKSHDRIQQEVYLHLWNKYPETRGNCWHTPNEFSEDYYFRERIIEIIGQPTWLKRLIEECKKRLIVHRSRRKATGVLAGVTDLVFYWKGVLYMFDIKIGSDRLSDAQKAFIESNTKQGGVFFEISSVQEGIEYIDKIMKS